MNATEHQLYFSFGIEGLEQAPEVLGFEAREKVSDTFLLTVDIATRIVEDESPPDLEAWIYRKAVLTINRAGEGPERCIHGLITRVTLLDQGRQHWLYQLHLEPVLALLARRRRYRIFHRRTLPDIVSEILDSLAPLRSQWCMDLDGDYQPVEYCVQYDETDLDFLQRLLSRAGIFYYFRHTAEAHQMVLADSPARYHSMDPSELDYAHRKGPLAAGEFSTWSFRQSRSAGVQLIRLRDYDYMNPDRDLLAQARSAKQSFGELVHDYYPGGFSEAAFGDDRARKLADSLRRDGSQTSGASDCFLMTTGFSFSLVGHPHGDMNRSWVLAELHHFGRQQQALDADAIDHPAEYRNRFVCTDADTRLPPVVPAQPRIPGVQTALVAGPEPGRVHTDELGRVRLRFHWNDGEGGTTELSRWVRAGQISAGSGWGAGFIPRVGQEVVVEFENGDPELPLVTGVVYNGSNRPQHFLPVTPSRSIIRSAFLHHEGKYSELAFEDGGDNPCLALYSDGELHLDSAGDHLVETGLQEHRYVHGDSHLQVDGDVHIVTLGSRRQRVQGSKWLQVEGNRASACDGSISEECEDNYSLQVGGRIVVDGVEGLTLSSGDSFIRLSAEGVTISGKQVLINSGGEADQVEILEMESPLPPHQVSSEPEGSGTLADLVGDIAEVPGPAARILNQASLDHSAFIDKCDS